MTTRTATPTKSTKTTATRTPATSRKAAKKPESNFLDRSKPQAKTMLLRLDQWSIIPDFPKQRDTENRAKRASKTYLSGPWNPAWDTVAAAVFPDGNMVKLDGHTRSYLWDAGIIAFPPNGKVTCHVYPVESLQEAERLYVSFNSAASSKNTADFIFGEMRSLGLLDQLQTPFLRRANLAEALRFATGIQDPQKAIGVAQDALLLFDSFHPKKNFFRSAILGAALLTIRAHGTKALEEFWIPYNQRDFERRGNRTNGPGAIEERNRDLTMAKFYGRDIEKALNRFALFVYEQSQTKKMILLPRTNSLEYTVSEMHRLKSASEYARDWGVAWGAEAL